jgi:hypothetical protein
MAASGMGMNDETVARIGLNEAAFRFANEERDHLADEGGLKELLLVCECGHAGCEETIAVTPEEYRRVRSHPDQFFVYPGHEIPEVEFVAAVNRGVQAQKQYLIVAKKPGLPAEVAERTNPRG